MADLISALIWQPIGAERDAEITCDRLGSAIPDGGISDNEYVLPGGWYRSQFWVIPGSGGPVLVCLGIHGQLIYADRAARTVVVKLSSWPDAQNTAYLLDTLRSCAAAAAHLSAGRVGETAPWSG